jgi:flavin-dependent dehydrogenase
MADDVSLAKILIPSMKDSNPSFELGDGSRVAVIGGGPAGSFFSHFLLSFANKMGTDVKLDIYEPRDFSTPAPSGCNMCGGIISESLVQMMAMEGINLPQEIVQRGIDSYVMHMDVGSVHIETPLDEMRIAAVHRGAGPKDIKEKKWGSFDGYLQKITEKTGAQVIKERVTNIEMSEKGPRVYTQKGISETYDLLAIATGVNTATLKIFKKLELAYNPPSVTKTFIREYYLGEDTIEKHLGSSMHVFLLDIPRLEFAAVIPKGDYVTVCLLGEAIDKELYSSFLNSPEVRACMPSGWDSEEFSCQCMPRMYIGKAIQPFDDRIVFLGDAGITRLYKDGIGGAYRAAKAAASTAIFHGVSTDAFKKHYLPAITAIDNDNAFGKVIFIVTGVIKKIRLARRAVLQMTAKEQKKPRNRRMSMILWDMFTGSAPYKEIFVRTLNPLYLIGLFWNLLLSIWPSDSNRV